MKQGSIYICNLTPVAGHEQSGTRPVLVVSNDEFNHRSGTVIIVPITNGGGFAERLGYALPLPQGIKTTGSVLCHQSRTIDLKARGGKFVETVPDYILEEAIERILSAY